ncbi:MAG TPA: trans-aconitate 2-methyltransferase [Streptosporangiaceae bacterium]|nr:trans-aconitate 2-methyltransferase [Streptosporangiaceae bacterium]
MWDPAQYLSFASERSRPFFDLTARIDAKSPAFVTDLGCGPGQLTAALAGRWPAATVEGIDSSSEMIAAASQMLADLPGAGRAAADRLSFRVEDVHHWRPDRPVDVVVSNAVLQWVPDHLELLPRWAGYLADSGWLAFQLPGNFDQPSHAILRELAASPRWRDQLAGVPLNRQSASPAEYLDLLAGLGLAVDAWATTYLHVLTGPDPVTEWYKGTGLRPVLNVLGPAEAEAFLAEYGQRVREAYPAASYGTVLPFRRVFVVAQKP